MRSAGKGSPVIIVGTRADDERCSGEYLNETRHRCPHAHVSGGRRDAHPTTVRRLDKSFVRLFPNIVGVHLVSPVTGKGIDALINNIRKVVSRQEFIERKMPSSYLELEKVVLQQAKSRNPPVLKWDAYRELAELCAIKDCECGDLTAATALLHSLGSLVHFANEDKLRNIVVLSPQWLMDVLATVVSTKHNYCRWSPLHFLIHNECRLTLAPKEWCTSSIGAAAHLEAASLPSRASSVPLGVARAL